MTTALDPDRFYGCSQFLLGIPLPQIQSLSGSQSLTYCRLLQANLVGDELAALGALLGVWNTIANPPTPQSPALFQQQVVDNAQDPTLWQVAQRLIALWYTGTWPGSMLDALTTRDPKNYPNLLAWVLAPDQHAMGVPKGQNYWSVPPADVETGNNQ